MQSLPKKRLFHVQRTDSQSLELFGDSIYPYYSKTIAVLKFYTFYREKNIFVYILYFNFSFE